jgi:hypothetical protein
MNRDDERKQATVDPEFGYALNDNRGMTKKEKDKAQYVLKEQMKRKKQLESESQEYLHMSYPHNRVQSLSIQSTMTETEFNERDWTPQDSSYGAAFPLCGFMPKSIRQLVEKVIIALVSVFIIYAIVSIAIMLTTDNSGGKSSSHKYDDFYITDDDFYVTDDERQAYNQKYDDDDDYLR